MIESLLYSARPANAPATSSQCEVSSLAETARALRMMDRELAQLRLEYQALAHRLERMRQFALGGAVLGGSGLVVALVSLLSR